MTKQPSKFVGHWAKAQMDHAEQLTRAMVHLAGLIGQNTPDVLNTTTPAPGAKALDQERWIRNGQKGHSL